MSSIIITNNPYVNEKYKDKMEVIYKDNFNYIQILEFLRDKIHEGENPVV